MIVDTSAIVAIALGELGGDVVKEALVRSTDSRISAPSYVELSAVLHRAGRPELVRLVDRLLDAFGIAIEPFTAEHARTAAQAYRDYGRGSGHPAKLNPGDTYSYAAAQISGESLLFVGDDFRRTDISPAVP